MKITQFRCKNNAQDIGTRCNFNIFAAGVSKLVFRIWNENKKLKYSGFVSERQEKICITYKGKRRQFACLCVFTTKKKTLDFWCIVQKLMLFSFLSFASISPSLSHHSMTSQAHSIDFYPQQHTPHATLRNLSVALPAGFVQVYV